MGQMTISALRVILVTALGNDRAVDAIPAWEWEAVAPLIRSYIEQELTLDDCVTIAKAAHQSTLSSF
jgi:hypothetical protein